MFVVEEGMRNSWTSGKGVKAIPGNDGTVRRVDVQTINGVAVLDVAVS